MLPFFKSIFGEPYNPNPDNYYFKSSGIIGTTCYVPGTPSVSSYLIDEKYAGGGSEKWTFDGWPVLPPKERRSGAGLQQMKKMEISLNELANLLAHLFKKMRAQNIETFKSLLPEKIEKMNQDDLKRLDWELCIFDMFNITYSCRMLIGDIDIYNRILDLLHKNIYEDFKKIDLMIAYTFQEESKAKYRTYFDVMRSSDPILEGAEDQARKRKIGLWSMPNPIPPWEYRKQHKRRVEAGHSGTSAIMRDAVGRT
jgi:hypothetical protein